ncbi:37S ribosomal protein, mitochondrial [Phialemonium atrogriseum]|uniref:37S ribosomal protein, mitochondrial n=1 Tax=Phialemonium atrogriseum TaxID=1093897 RepID=A0AAJ0FM63_9PEZI|nr:37S ribosomal protein, mitochondrial [Phialemonium atrogriseum]KAK1767474.1 37S ribosomal protein, mitochondrial [Phialemonium atrogriseum]
MILRNIAVRHGRKAFAAPAPRTCLRALSAATTTTTTPEATPLSGDASQTPTPAAFHNPRIPSRAAADQQSDTIPDDFRVFNTIQKRTKKLGSAVELRYIPDEILKNPPQDASLELLMASQAHMGHNTSLWNPANSRYIYGVRAGIHIISLEVTAAHLRRAARVVEDVAYRGGLVLFVGTRNGHMPIVVRAAELAGACHLFDKWTPGAITNRDQILASAELRIVDQLDRELEDFDKHLQDRRPVVPDLVVCLNPLENHTLLHECGLENIPTIGIIDTDADPTWVTYAIPANDDSLRAVAVIGGVLGRAGQRGQRRRLKDAENGIVTWENPTDISKFIALEQAAKEAAEKAEKKMAKARDQGGEQDGVSAAQLEAFDYFQKKRDQGEK